MSLCLRSPHWRNPRPVIVILSGAGLSAESGIPTYRNPANGWTRTDAWEHETAEADPAGFLENCNRRIAAYSHARPNAAHRALAEFAIANRERADIVHVTQNIDSLAEMAGDISIFHLHGSLSQSMCKKCHARFPRLGPYAMTDVCPMCEATDGAVRTDVVLFGEVPWGIEWIAKLVRKADIFLAVGTSGTVYPAAEFVELAAAGGCRDRILVTKDNPLEQEELRLAPANTCFTQTLLGAASVTLPPVLERITEVIEARAIHLTPASP